MNPAWPKKEPGLAQRSPDPLEGLPLAALIYLVQEVEPAGGAVPVGKAGFLAVEPKIMRLIEVVPSQVVLLKRLPEMAALGKEVTGEVLLERAPLRTIAQSD